MYRYLIRNTQSGAELGIFEADDASGALEIMATEAGYPSYEEACRVAPAEVGEISVTEID